MQGHSRSLTQIKYNKEGDLLFSVSKDQVVNVWYSHNGERLGTYNGHQGSIWTVDVDSRTKLLVTGAADNTARLWEVRTGKELHAWSFNTAVKRVQFSQDDRLVLLVTEQRMGFPGTVTVYKVDPLASTQASEPESVIEPEGSKATVAGWGLSSKTVVTGHEDGSVCLYDWNSGERLHRVRVQTELITDMQFSSDRSYFITSSKDKSAVLYETSTLKPLKIYKCDTPLNSAAITPLQEFVSLFVVVKG